MDVAARVISAIRVAPCPSLFLMTDDCHTIGPKVTNARRFFTIACERAENYLAHSGESEAGPWEIDLPPEANDFFSSGIGAVTELPSDYVVYGEGDQQRRYLKRKRSLPAILVVLELVSIKAYLAQLKPDTALARAVEEEAQAGVTHVITDISYITPVPMRITWNKGLARIGTLSLIPTLPTSD